MSIFESTSSTKGKCISCRFYKRKSEQNWTSGVCENKDSKAERKDPRFFDDKKCSQYRRNE